MTIKMGTNRSLFTWEMWKNGRKRWRGKGVGGGEGERNLYGEIPLSIQEQEK